MAWSSIQPFLPIGRASKSPGCSEVPPTRSRCVIRNGSARGCVGWSSTTSRWLATWSPRFRRARPYASASNSAALERDWMSEREVPVSRLGRLVRLASVGARTGASVLLSNRSAATAERAAEVLGTMRGLAAKVGQMLSYVDGFLPESQREVFEQAMQPLLRDAPTSSIRVVRGMVESELGAKIADLFLEFKDEPIASASIGQVHW